MRHQYRCIFPALAALAWVPLSVAIAQTTHTVELDGIVFIPPNIIIENGDTVHWVWVSGFHNVESGIIVGGNGIHDGNFRSGNPTSGAIFDLTFDQAFLQSRPMLDNLYPFYCIIHVGFNMAGTIRVVPRGDLNLDGTVDLNDQEVFTACVSGPDGTTPTGCSSVEASASDIDDDSDVDLRDFAELQRAFVP